MARAATRPPVNKGPPKPPYLFDDEDEDEVAPGPNPFSFFSTPPPPHPTAERMLAQTLPPTQSILTRPAPAPASVPARPPPPQFSDDDEEEEDDDKVQIAVKHVRAEYQGRVARLEATVEELRAKEKREAALMEAHLHKIEEQLTRMRLRAEKAEAELLGMRHGVGAAGTGAEQAAATLQQLVMIETELRRTGADATAALRTLAHCAPRFRLAIDSLGTLTRHLDPQLPDAGSSPGAGPGVHMAGSRGPGT